MHTTPEEFENGCFILKTHQMFLKFPSTLRRGIKYATITGQCLRSVFEETRIGKSHDHREVMVFQNVFCPAH